jgi:hypothetical protein
MFNNFPDDLYKHAETELENIGFKNSVGVFIMGLLQSSATLSGNNLDVMRYISNIPNILLNGGVLSPITEQDFGDEKEYDLQKDPFIRCKRYFWVYKNTLDGKYYDDRTEGFVSKDNTNNITFMNQGKYKSTKEIKLPYLPETKITYID